MIYIEQWWHEVCSMAAVLKSSGLWNETVWDGTEIPRAQRFNLPASSRQPRHGRSYFQFI